MKTISKSKLKAHMLEVFREIEKNGEELIVTDNNNPVLKIQPIKKKLPVRDVFGSFDGKIVYNEDPDVTTESEWDET